MKYKGQGKKEYQVLRFDDYDNQWIVYSKPVTIGQATWILQYRPCAKLKIVKIDLLG